MGNQANSKSIQPEEEEKDRDWNFNCEFSLKVNFTSNPGAANNVEAVPKSQKYMVERTREEFVQFFNEMGATIDSQVSGVALLSSMRCLRVLLMYLWAAVISLLIVGHVLNLPTVYTIGYICLVLYLADIAVVFIRLQPKMVTNYTQFVDQVDGNIEEFCEKYKQRLGNGFSVTFTKKHQLDTNDCPDPGTTMEDQDGFFFLAFPFLAFWPLGMAALFCNFCVMKCTPRRTFSYMVHVDYRVSNNGGPNSDGVKLQIAAPAASAVSAVSAVAVPVASAPVGAVPVGAVPVGAVPANGIPTTTNGVQGAQEPMVQITQTQYQQMMAMMAMMKQQFEQAAPPPSSQQGVQGVQQVQPMGEQPGEQQVTQGETYQ